MNESILLNTTTEKNHFKHSRFLFYIGMGFYIGAIFARNIMSISLPVILILAIGVLVALISDRNELIALALSCIPTSSAFQYKYLLLVIIAIYIIKFGKDVKYKAGVIPLVLMMTLELFHGLGYDFSIYQYLRDFSELILCTFLMMCEHRKIDYPMIVRILAISSACMMLIVFINLMREVDFDFALIFEGTYRFGVGNSKAQNYGVNYNANEVGMICCIVISSLLQLILLKKQRIVDCFLIITMLFFGVMTMSRAFFLCLLFIMLLFMYSIEAHFLKKAKLIMLVVLISVVVIMLAVNLMPTVFERFGLRFQEKDITGGRMQIMSFYNEHIFSSPKYLLWGVGLQDYHLKVYEIRSTGLDSAISCHNGTQEIVVCWGIIGLMVFLFFIKEMICVKKVISKRKIVHFIPLIVLFLFVQSIQLLYSNRALLTLSLACISVRWDESLA